MNVRTKRSGPTTRQRVLACVQAKPGIYKNKLCREMGLSWGTVTYHVAVLARRRQVRIVTLGKEARLFAVDVPERHLRWLAALSEEASVPILVRLSERPGASVADLSASLGFSHKILRRHLTLLTEEGLVAHDGQSRRRYHVDAQEALDLVQPRDPGDAPAGRPGDLRP